MFLLKSHSGQLCADVQGCHWAGGGCDVLYRGDGCWGRKLCLMLCCYISWQITSSGQTRGHRCPRTTGYFLSLHVFLSMPLCFSFSLSAADSRGQEDTPFVLFFFTHSERKQDIISSSDTSTARTGKAAASPPDLWIFSRVPQTPLIRYSVWIMSWGLAWLLTSSHFPHSP